MAIGAKYYGKMQIGVRKFAPAAAIGMTQPGESAVNPQFAGYSLTGSGSDTYVDDAAAAVGGVGIGYAYWNTSSNALKIRMT